MGCAVVHGYVLCAYVLYVCECLQYKLYFMYICTSIHYVHFMYIHVYIQYVVPQHTHTHTDTHTHRDTCMHKHSTPSLPHPVCSSSIRREDGRDGSEKIQDLYENLLCTVDTAFLL